MQTLVMSRLERVEKLDGPAAAPWLQLDVAPIREARLNGAAIPMTYNQGRPTPHPVTRLDLSHNGRPYPGLDFALLSW